MIERWDTSLRMRLAGIAILGLFIALAAAAYFSGWQVTRSSELIAQDAVPGTISAHYMRMAMSRSVGWVMVAASAQTTQSRDASLSTVHDADVAFTNALAEYEATIKINPARDRELLARVTAGYADYHRQRMAYEALILAGDREGGAAFLENNLVPVYVSAVQSAEELIKYNHANSLKYANYIHNSVDHLYWTVAVVTVLGLASAVVLVVNFSSRRREVMEMRKSEEKYRGIVEQSPLGIYQSSVDGRLISVNSALAAMFGYETAKQMLEEGDTIANQRFVRPEQRQEIVRAASASLVSVQREFEYRRKDSTAFPANLYMRAVRATDGTIQYLEGFIEDISIRKRAMEQLEMLKVSIDKHFDAAYWMDANNQFVYVNDSACQALGFTREEMLGQPVTLIAPKATPDQLQEVWKHLRKTGFLTRDSTHRRKNGSEFPVEIVASYVRFEGKEFNCGFARDITERKRAQAELLSKTALLEAQLDSTLDGILVVDTQGRKIIQNRQFLEMFQVPGEVERDVDDAKMLEHAANLMRDPRQFRERVASLYSHPDEIGSDEIELKDGRVFDRDSAPVRDKAGKHYGRIWVFRDITERRRVEQQIRRLNRVLAVLSGINGLIVRERNPKLLYEGACRIAADTGGFRMAWIGMLNSERNRLLPVASAGVVEGYLDFLNIDLNDKARRSGPSARAVLTGEHQICNDLAADPRMEPWRDEALRRGYRALASFPLCAGSTIVGVLTLFAAAIDYFDAEELRLLDELAADLGFALELNQQETERRRAEQSLGESEQRLRLALDSGQIGVWHQDLLNGTFTADDRLFDLFGIPLNESRSVPVETFLERVHVEDRRIVAAELGSLWNGATNANAEFRAARPDGSTRQVVSSGVSVTGDDGKVKRVVGITIDVTERKDAERQRETLVHDLGERVKELRLLHQTARLLQRDHASIKELLDEWVPLFPAAWQYPECCQARITYQDIEASTPGWRDSEWKQSVRIKATDGVGQIDVVYLEDRPAAAEGPFLSEERTLLNSLTEMLVGYLELRRHRENLESLVESRTRDMSLAKEEAERANRAKGVFLANISHEIRTPMNAILGYAQLLENDPAIAEVPRKKASIIRSSGDHLLQIVNDVLEASRIEAGRVKLVQDVFDLRSMLDDVRDMFVPLAAGKRNELIFESGPGIPEALLGDAGKVRQVVINLLSNAVKFTNSGKIHVKTAAQSAPAGHFVVSILVTDTGRGIAEQDLGRIFSAFEQTESGIRAGGTGLGLTISRSFSRMMGGDLTVTSRPGEGSTFQFSFAAEAAPEGTVVTRHLPSANLRLETARLGCKVLIVDDIATNRDVLEDLLTRTGFEVRMAADGEEGISIHNAWGPQLVLMDLRMPGIDGIEAIRRLRLGGSRAVLVALTASSIPESRDLVLKAGGNDMILKPYRERELLAAIGKLLGLQFTVPDGTAAAASAEQIEKSAAVPLTELLKQVPVELIEQLHEAALQARVGRIEVLAKQVAAHSPRAADEILLLARNFQYDTLLATVGGDRKT
jgi:PAS domain S-box-containing protein